MEWPIYGGQAQSDGYWEWLAGHAIIDHMSDFDIAFGTSHSLPDVIGLGVLTRAPLENCRRDTW